ncbi:MAG: hypothetical protein F7B11_05465 [Caldisphaeraceae archaeon]|nr:hypothetical protein [Caldisphaeraceae archaeon]
MLVMRFSLGIHSNYISSWPRLRSSALSNINLSWIAFEANETGPIYAIFHGAGSIVPIVH